MLQSYSDGRYESEDHGYLLINPYMCKNKMISQALEELGFKLMSKHASSEQNAEVLNGYIAIIERESIKKNRPDLVNHLFYNGLV